MQGKIGTQEFAYFNVLVYVVARSAAGKVLARLQCPPACEYQPGVSVNFQNFIILKAGYFIGDVALAVEDGGSYGAQLLSGSVLVRKSVDKLKTLKI